jgi:hypothetical protein
MALAVLLGACQLPSSRAGAAPRSTPEPTDCSPAVLDRAAFPDAPRIDNTFHPFAPGMQFVLDGFVVGPDGSRHPHRIETTVTQLTKVIDGVTAMVIFERDFQDGRMTESELAFLAQDSGGAVWNMGEFPEEYDNGQLLGAPSAWLSGVAGARAGMEMVGHPRVGDPPFQEGLAPGVGFKDCAVVYQTGQHVCVQGHCYDGVLVVDEFAPLNKREGHQRKFYAPGVGTIKVGAAGGADPEELELTKAARLCSSELAGPQALAMAQDGRGYRVASDVYAGTAPARETLRAQPC